MATAATHLPPFWIPKTLYPLGAKPGVENQRVLEAQQRAEGGTAKWNPLNSTLKLPGSSPMAGNSAGVQDYPWPVIGICAQVMTIAGRDDVGHLEYPGILGDLQAGIKTAEQIVNDNHLEYLKWAGGDAGYVDLILEILREV